MWTRLHSLLTSPTRSTRSTGRLWAPWVDCCYRHDSVLFTDSTTVASQVIYSARGVSRAILLAPFSSHLPSTPPQRRPALPRRPLARVGLTFALFTSMTASLLPSRLVLGTFRVVLGLGPPISSFWVLLWVGRRVGKARALLTAIGKFPDAQGAFCLLRSCSGWSKVLYSSRTVPPDVRSLCG